MRRGFCLWVLMWALVACGGNNSTGSTTFVANELTVAGNPDIRGEASGTEANPSGFITIGGIVDNKLNLELTGLSVQIRVLGANNALLGASTVSCSPATVAPSGSSTFQASIALLESSYRASTVIEITPICNQGTGTVRNIALQWPE